MAKKSKLLQEIDENIKIYDNKDINIEELNKEILKELCNWRMIGTVVMILIFYLKL